MLNSKNETASREATAFRRWTCPSNDASVESQEVVPGLRRVLENVGLASYTVAAESWCSEMGAAFLADVAEEVDELVAALDVPEPRGGLALSKREQLHRELLAHLEGARGSLQMGEQAAAPSSPLRESVRPVIPETATSFYDPSTKVPRTDILLDACCMRQTDSGRLVRTLATSFTDLCELETPADAASEETQPCEDSQEYDEEEDDSEGSEGQLHGFYGDAAHSSSGSSTPVQATKW